MSTLSGDEPPAHPTTRSASAFAGAVEPARPARLRGEVVTGVVARPWTGWLLLVFGAAAFVGALGPWVDAVGVTVNGGVLDGRWSAWFALGVVVIGILMALGLGYRWLCLLGMVAAGGTVAYGVPGYHAGRDVIASAPPAAWGVHLCVGGGAAAAVAAVVGAMVRAPYRLGFDRPVRHAPAAAIGASARSEPVVGGALLAAGLLGMIGSGGPWTSELIPPDQYGFDGDGVVTVATTAVVAGCGLLILNAAGRLWVSVVALVAAALSGAVSFVDYADAQRLTRGYVIHGGEFYSIAWGLYLVLAASIVGVGVAVRAVSRRGTIVATGS